MKIYVAGPLCGKQERKFVEIIAKLVESLGFKTYVPHRDCGLYKKLEDVDNIAKKDVEEIYICDAMIGILNGFVVGAGTAWEMGYAEALGKPVIGLKTDKKVSESIAEVSAVIAGKVKIAENLDELKKWLRGLDQD